MRHGRLAGWRRGGSGQWAHGRGEGAGGFSPSDRGGGQSKPGVRAPDGPNAGGRHDAADRGKAFPGDGPAFRVGIATLRTRIAAGGTNVAGPFYGGRDGAHDVPGSDLPSNDGASGGHGAAYAAAGDIPGRGVSRSRNGGQGEEVDAIGLGIAV